MLIRNETLSILQLLISLSELGSLVEVEFLHFPASAVRYLGRGFYIVSYQYIWSNRIFEIGLDSRPSGCFKRSADNFVYR